MGKVGGRTRRSGAIFQGQCDNVARCRSPNEELLPIPHSPFLIPHSTFLIPSTPMLYLLASYRGARLSRTRPLTSLHSR